MYKTYTNKKKQYKSNIKLTKQNKKITTFISIAININCNVVVFLTQFICRQSPWLKLELISLCSFLLFLIFWICFYISFEHRAHYKLKLLIHKSQQIYQCNLRLAALPMNKICIFLMIKPSNLHLFSFFAVVSQFSYFLFIDPIDCIAFLHFVLDSHC